MSRRLTKEIRRQIADAATEGKQKAEEDALRDNEDRLARLAYDKVFSKEVRDWANNPIGDKWLFEDTCLRFNAGGWNVVLHLKDKVKFRVPRRNHWNSCEQIGVILTDDPLTDEIHQHVMAKKKFEETGGEIKVKVRTMLNAIYNFKRLREVWPEGLPYYKDLDTDTPSLPAVRVDEINKLLGLPKEDDNAGTDEVSLREGVVHSGEVDTPAGSEEEGEA